MLRRLLLIWPCLPSQEPRMKYVFIWCYKMFQSHSVINITIVLPAADFQFNLNDWNNSWSTITYATLIANLFSCIKCLFVLSLKEVQPLPNSHQHKQATLFESLWILNVNEFGKGFKNNILHIHSQYSNGHKWQILRI